MASGMSVSSAYPTGCGKELICCGKVGWSVHIEKPLKRRQKRRMVALAGLDKEFNWKQAQRSLQSLRGGTNRAQTAHVPMVKLRKQRRQQHRVKNGRKGLDESIECEQHGS